MTGMARGMVGAMALGLALLAAPRPVAAHCDSLDGPVVQAARQALASGDVARVLVWVRPQDEPEIRSAFARTLQARKLGGPARDLSDLWFFETLLRVHRAGEGEPYTGLKPAGYAPPAGIAAADRALASGSVARLAQGAANEVAQALETRFEQVQALAKYSPGDVEAGRRYVHAYVEYVHFVEQLHELVHGGGEAHAAAGEKTEAAVVDSHP